MTPAEALGAIALIAAGFLLVAALYESLSTRDVYVGRIMRIARGRTSRPAVLAAVYVATVGIGIPILVVAWALVLSVALIVVGSLDRVTNAAFVAVSVVGAARVLAYARQKTAQDLAKAIPLALAFLLISGGALDLDEKLERLQTDSQASDLSPELLLLLTGLELTLRIMTDGLHAAMAAYRRRRGIDSDLGFWRTLWAAIRHPLARELAVEETESRR